MPAICYGESGRLDATIGPHGQSYMIEDPDSGFIYARFLPFSIYERNYRHFAGVAWSSNKTSLAFKSETTDRDNTIYMLNFPNLKYIHSLNKAIKILSLAQQNFIISLARIVPRLDIKDNRHPLIFLPETHAYKTFKTLPTCLQQLLIDSNCVRLSFSLLEQPGKAVSYFVQNHWRALALAAAGIALGTYLALTSSVNKMLLRNGWLGTPRAQFKLVICQ